MSIVVVMEWDGVVPTQDQYWAVTEKFGLQDKLPDGCEYHVIGIEPENKRANLRGVGLGTGARPVFGADRPLLSGDRESHRRRR